MLVRFLSAVRINIYVPIRNTRVNVTFLRDVVRPDQVLASDEYPPTDAVHTKKRVQTIGLKRLIFL